MNHYFYKITNRLNGKYYFGVRSYSGDPEKDYYMGSGPIVKAAVRKYGKENFSREVLKLFGSQEEAYRYEKEHVTLKEVLDPQCYNVQLGGLGGTKGAIFLQKGEKVVRVLPEMREQFEKQGFVQYHKHYSDSIDQMKIKLRSMIWVHRGFEESRIPKEDLESRESEGWVVGRNPKLGKEIRKSLKEFNSRNPKTKRKYVYSGEKVTSVPISELQNYLDQGWFLGNGRKGKTKH